MAQAILDANPRQRFGIMGVAIQHQDHRMEFNPDPDMAIPSENQLVGLGRPQV